MTTSTNIGIYIVISPSNRKYIGQSVNIKERLRRYLSLSVKTKKQTKLWRSLLKHGSDNHRYFVLENCEIDKLNEKERYFQEFFNSVEDGLNCNYTKTNQKSGKVSKETLHNMSVAQKLYFKTNKHPFDGRKHSQETKDKIRLKSIGRKHSDKVNKSKGRKGSNPPLKGLFGVHNPISKAINQYSKKGELIKKWDCALDIKRCLGFSNSNISSCCSGKLKTSSGFIWKFA